MLMVRVVGNETWSVELDSPAKAAMADDSCFVDESHQCLIV
jgi:hypothetical protein